MIKGRSYLREMKALSLTVTGGSGNSPVANHRALTQPGSPATGGDMEAAGFVLAEQTVLDVGCLDLLQCHPRCRRALILDRDDLPRDTRLLEHLQGQGIDAAQLTRPGYADLMAEPHYTRVPGQAIAAAVEWLRAAEEKADNDSGVSGSSISFSAPLGVSHSSSVGPNLRERIVRMVSGQELFGIVSEPSEPVASQLPFVVILNAGSSYRVGPNRLHVSLARQLSSRGFRCLRMDLSGLGDSVASDPARENDPYPATAFRDIDAVLKYLRSEFGVERVVLIGLCSGAYAAFQCAVWLSDTTLVESVVINPLTFWWKEGMSLDVSPARRIQAFDDCLASLFKPKKWLKLL